MLNEKIICDIVIVDSGLFFNNNESVASINGIYFYADDNENIVHDRNIADRIGHGTAVYNIINPKKTNNSCYIIKIFDEDRLFTNENILLHALKHIENNICCKIINLSVGINILYQYQELYDICLRLTQKNILIVSAFDNEGAISYPAAFDMVIGVISDDKCIKKTEVVAINHPIINIGAKGSLQRIVWKDSKSILATGNSFACAHVSRLLLNYLKTMDAENARRALYENAVYTYDFNFDNNIYETCSPVNFYKKAVLFPFNKEMHSLVRFSHLLHFEIVDIYDVRHSARVGAGTNHLLKINKKDNYIIKNINDIDWNSFDTLILGHTRELRMLLKNDSIIDSIIEKSFSIGKYIYSFDKITLPTNIPFDCNHYFTPTIKSEHINKIPYGYLYCNKTPTLGVFGTSSRQGKFSLQLLLREMFIRDGYKIGQIGSEPTSFLYGMDACYHFGYDSNNKIIRYDAISYLNDVIHKISNKSVDIIISSCQSGTVTPFFNNLSYYNFAQYEFLLGTQPDAVLLCINSTDDMALIKRTINFIESSTDCKVLSLVLFPINHMDPADVDFNKPINIAKINKIKILVTEEIALPIFVLGDQEEMNQLYTSVINYFNT